jgi:hypothetical protein
MTDLLANRPAPERDALAEPEVGDGQRMPADVTSADITRYLNKRNDELIRALKNSHTEP